MQTIFWKELQSLISTTFWLQHLGQALPADSGRLGEEATTRRARAQGQDTVLHHSETELQKRVFCTMDDCKAENTLRQRPFKDVLDSRFYSILFIRTRSCAHNQLFQWRWIRKNLKIWKKSLWNCSPSRTFWVFPVLEVLQLCRMSELRGLQFLLQGFIPQPLLGKMLKTLRVAAVLLCKGIHALFHALLNDQIHSPVGGRSGTHRFVTPLPSLFPRNACNCNIWASSNSNCWCLNSAKSSQRCATSRSSLHRQTFGKLQKPLENLYFTRFWTFNSLIDLSI